MIAIPCSTYLGPNTVAHAWSMSYTPLSPQHLTVSSKDLALIPLIIFSIPFIKPLYKHCIPVSGPFIPQRESLNISLSKAVLFSEVAEVHLVLCRTFEVLQAEAFYLNLCIV